MAYDGGKDAYTMYVHPLNSANDSSHDVIVKTPYPPNFQNGFLITIRGNNSLVNNVRK